jgi:hypothetical protein
VQLLASTCACRLQWLAEMALFRPTPQQIPLINQLTCSSMGRPIRPSYTLVYRPGLLPHWSVGCSTGRRIITPARAALIHHSDWACPALRIGGVSVMIHVLEPHLIHHIDWACTCAANRRRFSYDSQVRAAPNTSHRFGPTKNAAGVEQAKRRQRAYGTHIKEVTLFPGPE